MLDPSGFDQLAEEYDGTVRRCDEANEFPFAGYTQVLERIAAAAKAAPGIRILDVGFGTGRLTKRLYDSGATVFGIDFSEKMIGIAREKMPDAVLLRHDFAEGLPEELDRERFDAILCTYAIHHLDDPQKSRLIRQMLARLAPGGRLLIGDVMFETEAERDRCRDKLGERWDEQESYPIVECLRRSFPELTFHRVSFCSGVLSLLREEETPGTGGGSRR